MTKLTKLDGRPIRDARKSIVLHITGDDVKNGNRKQPNSCAAAIACKRHFGAEYAMVHLSRAYVDMGEVWLRFITPASMRREIIAFDKGKPFSEGAYILGAPSPSAQTGKRRVTKGTHPHLGRKGVKNPSKGRRSKPVWVDGVRFIAGAKIIKTMTA